MILVRQCPIIAKNVDNVETINKHIKILKLKMWDMVVEIFFALKNNV